MVNSTKNNGVLEAYVNPSLNFPITVSASYNNKSVSQTLNDLTNPTLTLSFQEKTQIISGVFNEYASDTTENLITSINGGIQLSFNYENEDYLLNFNSNKALSNNFDSGKMQENKGISKKGKPISWRGEFIKGVFTFILVLPEKSVAKNCELGITHNSVVYTHEKNAKYSYANKSYPSADNFTITPKQPIRRLVIPFYHPRRTYSFTANLVRFPSQQLITEQHNANLVFEHRYINAVGTSVTTEYNIRFVNTAPNCPRANNQINHSLAPTETSFNFNNGNYGFNLYDIVGEIINGEVKIDYYGAKTHLSNRTNGYPQTALTFNRSSPVPPKSLIPLNPILNNNNLTIPLNGWEHGFEVIPSRQNVAVNHNHNFNGHPMPMIKVKDHEHGFDDLNFEISAPDLHYNNASKEDMGFAVNIYVYDRTFAPVTVKMDKSWAAGKGGRRDPINSLDIENLANPGLFLPVHMDPLPFNMTLNRENLLINPKKNVSTFNLGLDFADSHNQPILGTFFVLAEVVPCHFIKNAGTHDVTIDSIGHPEYALYILEVNS